MSICLESAGTATALPGTQTQQQQQLQVSATQTAPLAVPSDITKNNVSKLVLPGAHTNVLQKVANTSVITVVNTPITVVKSLSGSTASHFTLVNNAPPLKSCATPPTITLVPPITVVKSLPPAQAQLQSPTQQPLLQSDLAKVEVVPLLTQLQLQHQPQTQTNNGSLSVAPIAEKTPSAGIHNVFVKKSSPTEGAHITVPDMPQSHKILTANTFPTTVIPNLGTGPILKTANGQRSLNAPAGKVKILSNVVTMPGGGGIGANIPGPSTVVPAPGKGLRYYQQQQQQRASAIGNNNGAAKYLNRPPPENKKVLYPTHKSQLKMLPNYKQPPPPPTNNTMKALSPGAVQRTGSGLRTIPPQRPSAPNKPNYIGKHAVQAQKMKPKVKTKASTGPSPNNSHMNRHVLHHHHPHSHHHHQPPHPAVAEPSAQTIFNQALTAQILETLSDKDSSSSGSSSKLSSPLMNSYLSSKYPEPKQDVILAPKQQHQQQLQQPLPLQQQQSLPQTQLFSQQPQHQPAPEAEITEYKPKPLSTLDTLSFVCHAALLDHNYNATLPADPTPPPPPTPPQVNGTQQFSPVPNYPSQGVTAIKRNRTSSQTLIQRDDDAASDISEEHKNDTEGEETDTAPEAEAVTNEANDRYGDYVTRCICGFIHDDGYMIECDKCKVWQHVRCVVKTKKVPEDYLCEECDPSKHTDKQKARLAQQQWMREIQERDAKIRKEQMALTDSDSSDAGGPEPQKPRRKEPPPRRQRRDSVQNRNSSAKPGKRKERKVTAKRTKTKQPVGKSDDEKVPQLRQWIENYEIAVTNHYSPELRARIPSVRSNGAAHLEVCGAVDPSVNNCKVHTLPTGLKCLVTTASLPMGTPIIELRGKYMLSTQHRATSRQQRPGPFLFFHTLTKDTEVCVDTRTYGNCARFIRRSCTPNAELRHVLEKGTVHLYVVTSKSVDKGAELTIRHESHDLNAPHVTEIPCACLNPEYCALLKGHRRHNGDSTPVATEGSRKRRGRQSRENTLTSPPPNPTPPETVEQPEETKKKKKEPEEIEVNEEPVEIKEEIKEEEPIEIKIEAPEEIKEEPVVDFPKEEPKIEVKEEIKEEVKSDIVENEVKEEIKPEPEITPKDEVHEEEEETPAEKPPPPVTTRRASRHAQENQHKDEASTVSGGESSEKDKKKLNREERKLEAIMKAIERMEKQEQRKQEHQAKQAHRRESEPTVNNVKEDCPKVKRRKRKGRSRTISTSSSRRNRLDSVDSLHSSDDTLVSPPPPSDASPSKAAGMLLSLGNKSDPRKSPDRTIDSNSNSAHSSPETPLSSACVLVAAAVEPFGPGFKFPKTKKVLMNEWLNKAEVVQSASAISPSSLQPHIENNYFNPVSGKNPSFCDQQPRSGSAKKRWLRQAISEDQCDSPPLLGNQSAPPKKRRLPRESLSGETSPPTTPTTLTPQTELVPLEGADESPVPMETEPALDDATSEVRQDFSNCVLLEHSSETPPPQVTELPPRGALLDPRLARFSNSELVGTVEKTLSFLGFEGNNQVTQKSHKPEPITPAKRKLSITEYRQRKRLNNNETSEKCVNDEILITEESNSSQSPKALRPRSDSTSSITSETTSDEDITVPDVKIPVLSAFNSEPTELERERETASLRLKMALGLPVKTAVARPTTLNVESILKGELMVHIPDGTSPIDCPITAAVQIPTPLVYSVDVMETVTEGERRESTDDSTVSVVLEVEDQSVTDISGSADESVISNFVTTVVETVKRPMSDQEDARLLYTPDDEEMTECISEVPVESEAKFQSPGYTTYGSVIDDDVPYEGRNPSPPPSGDGP